MTPLSPRTLALIVTGILLSSWASPAPAAPVDSQLFNKVLTSVVDQDGWVDYDKLQADQALKGNLNTFFKQLEAHSPVNSPQHFPSEADKKAYWINAYNAFTIALILEHYPIHSVMDVKTANPATWVNGAGFFEYPTKIFGGETLSLNKIEKTKLKGQFNDPRYHFGINCASIGCPPLLNRVYKAETLDADLDLSAKRFINNSLNVCIDHEAKKIKLSTIFTWYEAEFLEVMPQDQKHIVNYVVKYANPKFSLQLIKAKKSGYAIEYLNYDWGLNKVKK